MALPLVGAPVTSAPVALPAAGPASLKDANGYVSLMATPTPPSGWPPLFGVVATANGALFDLDVVYDPQPGGPAASARRRGSNISRALRSLPARPTMR